MLNIEEVKKEYFRIAKLLKKEALTGDDYNHNCKEGFTVFQIKKNLGLSWNGMKEIIGAPKASNANRKGGIKKLPKIYCRRGEGKMIRISECLPMCNTEACTPCENKQMQNKQAINNTSPSEDRELNYTSSFGNSGALAADEGNYTI